MSKKVRLNPKEIDYKDIKSLEPYLTPAGKIVSSSVTRLDVRSQRTVARHIKRARLLALLPYVDYRDHSQSQ